MVAPADEVRADASLANDTGSTAPDGTGLVLLDGGMGKTLLAQGAPFRQPEWSALALLEAPGEVRRAHDRFVAAGADVITTNNYAVVPFHLGTRRFDQRGAELTDLAGRLARDAARAAGRSVQVAGSIPPLYGSYEPDAFRPGEAVAHLDVIVDALAPHVDLFLAETQSSIVEATYSLRAAARYDIPRWAAFTLCDRLVNGRALLRSGESVTAAVELAATEGATAVLFNCSPPEVIEAALLEAGSVAGATAIGAYANSFVPEFSASDDYAANEVILAHRPDLDPVGYALFVDRWVVAGATIIGGCCGIMPEHIALLDRGRS